jgi:Cu(I)/Ag(I) efflux system membrane fusion protein
MRDEDVRFSSDSKIRRVAMKCLTCLFALVAVAGLSIAMIGCSEGPQPAPVTDPAPAVEPADDEHAGHDHPVGEEHDEQAEALAGLSAEDRALAVKQKICPVAGAPLGSMGVPVKVTVKDRDVFLCCEGCRGSLLEDPDKYLAKLDAAE